MGGKSSQTQQQDFQDNRVVQGEGAIQATTGGQVTITSTALDNGAIGRAFDTTDATVSKALNFGGNALNTVAAAARQVVDNTATTQQLVADAYNDAKGRGALTDKILIGAVAGSLLVAAMAVKAKG